jgi:hypothetical protein
MGHAGWAFFYGLYYSLMNRAAHFTNFFIVYVYRDDFERKQIMTNQLTTRNLLSVILCTLALGSYGWASGGFLDDFSDGDIQDGSPVTWGWDPYMGIMGECLVTPEGLQLKPDWPAHKEEPMWRGATDAYGRPVHYTGSITIRTQVKMPEATTGFGSSVLLVLRATDDWSNCYFVCLNRQSLWICRMDGPEVSYSPLEGWHYWMNGSFDAKNDVMIQVDAIDLTDTAGNRTTSRLDARWWVAGQEMPVEPQLSVYDATYEAGGIAIGASCDSELNRAAIFRWIEVIGSEVKNEPIVDFNGDGIVDSADMCMMIDYWGTDEQLYDIAPPPSGDGIVDVQDLILLSEHLFEEIYPTELIAYWKLDETEGAIAYDIVGDKNALLFGNPVWRSAEGKTNGTLELDGIDDYISTNFVLNPEDKAFSVFAWMKGGEPEQVIISQTDGINGIGETWLGIDSLGGNLMTGLVPPPLGRFITQPLGSQAVVTDGLWHHVGFVWDGSYRILYVDGIEVAKDTAAQNQLKSADGGLYIGADKTLDAGTFFSGLIDDVRIYNAVLSAEEIAALAQ